MSMSTFIIYYNSKLKQIDVLHDCFFEKKVNEDGKVECIMHTEGHEKLYNDLKNMNISKNNVIIKGILFNNNEDFSIYSLETMNNFCFNNNDVCYQANLKNISIPEERKYFSNVVLNFVLSKFDKAEFETIIRNRIIGVNKFFKNNKRLLSSIKDNQR